MESANRIAETKQCDKSPAWTWVQVQPYVFLALRLFLGVIFLFASYDKILHPEAFARIVFNYQLLPESLINLTAIVLPWLELLLGLCLIAGLWLPGTALISTGLFTVFVSSLIFNLSRGLDVQCGCFSTQGDVPAGLGTVARDLTFLAASAYLTWMLFMSNRHRFRPLAPMVR